MLKFLMCNDQKEVDGDNPWGMKWHILCYNNLGIVTNPRTQARKCLIFHYIKTNGIIELIKTSRWKTFHYRQNVWGGEQSNGRKFGINLPKKKGKCVWVLLTLKVWCKRSFQKRWCIFLRNWGFW
jgi:hypothetical protein